MCVIFEEDGAHPCTALVCWSSLFCFPDFEWLCVQECWKGCVHSRDVRKTYGHIFFAAAARNDSEQREPWPQVLVCRQITHRVITHMLTWVHFWPCEYLSSPPLSISVFVFLTKAEELGRDLFEKETDSAAPALMNPTRRKGGFPGADVLNSL